MIWRSTLTPVCLVYVSASARQNGAVLSLLYSAITTLIDRAPPLVSGPRSHAVRPRRAATMTATTAKTAGWVLESAVSRRHGVHDRMTFSFGVRGRPDPRASPEPRPTRSARQ